MSIKANDHSRFKVLKGVKTSFIVSAIVMGMVTQGLSGAVKKHYVVNVSDSNFTTSENIVYSSDVYDRLIGIRVNTNNSTIINNHLININSSIEKGDVVGIEISNLSNNVHIINNENINVNGAFTYSVGIGSLGSLTNFSIINKGTITAESSNISYGMLIMELSNSSILNTGTIKIKSKDESEGIYVGNLLNSYIRNEGIITVDSIHRSVGISVDSGTGSIINSGTVSAKSAISTNDFSGTIINEKGGILNGHIYTPDAFLLNKGELNIPISEKKSDFVFDSSVVKNFTQTASGTLGIKLNIDEEGNSKYSNIEVKNKALLEDGTTIKVDVTALGSGATILLDKNSTLTGIIKAGIIEVNTDKLNITDNSILLDFEALLSDSNRSLDLKVNKGSISKIANDVSRSKQLGGAGKVLDTLALNDNKEIKKFMNNLYLLPTKEAVAQAVSQVTPSNTASTQSVANQITNTMSSVVGARQSSQRGLSSGDIAFSDKNVWLKPFGGYTSQDDKDGISGFSANTFGLGFGVDGEYKSGYRAGLALFYTNADVDTNDVDQSSDIDVFNLVAYGSNPIIDDKTNLFYQIGFGLQKTNSSRVISGVGTAKADYTSKNLFLQLKVQRDIEINKSFQVKPAFITSYAYYKNPSYSENGAGGINLDVEKFSAKSFVLGVESEFTYNLDENSQLLANVALSYDFYNDAQSINSSFQGGGTVFSTQGIKNDALIYKVGVGFMRKLQNNLFIDLKYDFDGRGSEFKNHVISSRINYKF